MNMQNKTPLKLLRNTANYRKNPKGLLTNMYHHQKSRNLKNHFGDIGYSLKEFHEKFLLDKLFNRLYTEWVKSNYQKALKPSVDRINHKKGYTIDNIHMLTWSENRFKQTIERRVRKGKVLQILDGKIIKIWRSQREAYKKLNLQQSMLSMALTGRCKTAYGYEWKYENPELLETL